jgi:glycerol-3-phosphate cytidylyltransferase
MKVGITFSAFDLLHAGHIKMLEEASNIYLRVENCLVGY